MRAMALWTDRLPQITLWEDAFTLDLLTDAEGCRGAVVSRSEHEVTLVWAKQTILCTGGAGQLYRETSNPEVATGDGIAAAYRAGAALCRYGVYAVPPDHALYRRQQPSFDYGSSPR